MSFLARHRLTIASILLIATLYLPFLAHGGLIIDDWAVFGSGQVNPGLVPAYKGLFEQFSNRPLAPLIFSVASNLFQDHSWMYVALDVLLWLCAVGLTAHLIAKHLDRMLGYFFFLFAAIPAFTSTVIFSPAVLLMGSASVLLWAFSLYCLTAYLKTSRRWWQLGAYLLVLASILTYEATLPLLVVTVLWPWIMHGGSMRELIGVKYSIRYLLPVAGIIILVLLYQKAIIPLFVGDISRLRFRGLTIIPAVLSKFLLLLAVDIPALLGGALQRLGSAGIITVGGIAAAVALLAGSSKSRQLPPNGHQKRLAWAFGLATASTVILYFLAGTVPTVHGYDNRGLIGCGIALAGLLACLAHYSYHRAPKLFILMILVLGLMSLSFAIQRNNYIRSSRLQTLIVEDIKKLVDGAAVPRTDTILVHVPSYLNLNYNNETIFSDEQDAKIGIGIEDEERVGIRLTRRRIEFGRARIENDILISDDVSVPVASAWYYDGDEQLRSSLVKIRDSQHLQTLLNTIALEPPPTLPFDAWGKAVGWYVEHINVPDLRAQYQQYRARWGYN
jgi:hypothetical protein